MIREMRQQAFIERKLRYYRQAYAEFTSELREEFYDKRRFEPGVMLDDSDPIDQLLRRSAYAMRVTQKQFKRDLRERAKRQKRRTIN